MTNAFGAMSSVCPSGALLRTNSAPMLPLAPGLFSTTIEARLSFISVASVRARKSFAAPGLKGTTSRIGLVGNVCADAWSGNPATANAARRRPKRKLCMDSLVDSDACVLDHFAPARVLRSNERAKVLWRGRDTLLGRHAFHAQALEDLGTH